MTDLKGVRALEAGKRERRNRNTEPEREREVTAKIESIYIYCIYEALGF